MFTKHYKKQLSAYAHGELSQHESALVASHLRSCASCHAEFEEIRFGVRLAECLPSVSAPEKLWEGIESAMASEEFRAGQRNSQARTRESAARTRETARLPAPRLSGGGLLPFFAGRRAYAYAFAVACVALVAGGTWFYVRSTRPTWDVARIEGAPRIDSDSIGERGRLGVGEWLETDANSRAEIAVANIGEVEVEPNTRVRLVTTRMTEHRLELARGTLHARIFAPPRLFFVNTPSAVAADLGCAYTLEVDDEGRSLLHVTSGYVALEAGERESIVPAGAACLTKPGTGPGTPFFEDASEEFVEMLSKLDFENDHTVLDPLLASARPRDTLTLWHLLSRVGGDERARVYARLAALTPPPEGVTRDGVLRLDRAMLDAWKDQLEYAWLSESIPAVRRVWRKLWK
ncbi:MAG TPA: FecR domain-containing protein [Pyrinomonadaceae bacterium]|nr:FecR domain-containing protein [Pyrinomonadaceae bacterium]